MTARVLIVVGLTLMGGFLGLLFAAGGLPEWFVWPLGGALALGVGGAATLGSDHARMGAWLIIVSGFFFFPLGAIAMAGARLELDAITRRQFSQRRITP